MASIHTKEDIKRKLWAGANELRGTMEASKYKDYMLGLIFYKFLSDKTLDCFRNTSRLSKEMSEQDLMNEYIRQCEVVKHIKESIKKRIGYCIEPQDLYQYWVRTIQSGDFELQMVVESLNRFERSIANGETSEDFKGLFSSSDMDFQHSSLGDDLNKRSKKVSALILQFADLDMIALQKGDVLGDAYEYLIGQFAMESGKKAGEFYTPRQVSEVMAQIVAKSGSLKSIYDPTVGSGSLLLTVGKHLTLDEQNDLHYYGQEAITATYNLTRMNLILHGIKPEKMTINNGDTLMRDWPEDPEQPNQGVLFDAVVMNPPYSQKNWNSENLTKSDPRFEFVGTLPPESKGDFAFLLHGLYHLSTSGTMAIVLPHGVLFRGGEEGKIRKRLIEKNCIDAVIGMPSNMFTNTSIPVAVLILKKNRPLDAPILFIDSSKHFIKVGKHNELQEKDIARIVDTYVSRNELEGFSRLASRQEIEENEHNLNIPRYVDSSAKAIPHDVDAHLNGGIPVANILELNVLQDEAEATMNNSLTPLRDGYVAVNKSIDTLYNEILQSQFIVSKKQQLHAEIDEYLNQWWGRLKQVTNKEHLMSLKEAMFEELKTLLGKYSHVDIYDGVQIIADIWKDHLTSDLEAIASVEDGIYEAARKRQPHYEEKSQNKQKANVQEGFDGVIINKKLIERFYYTEQLNELNNIQQQITDAQANLDELFEEATTDEESILTDALNEKGDCFTLTAVKEAIKSWGKDSEEGNRLKELQTLMQSKNSLNKQSKELAKILNTAAEDRILELTKEEIDTLMFEKWFGNVNLRVLDLVEKPIRNDLSILSMLIERYADTLQSLDAEIESLEAELNAMISELVVRP